MLAVVIQKTSCLNNSSNHLHTTTTQKSGEVTTRILTYLVVSDDGVSRGVQKQQAHDVQVPHTVHTYTGYQH